MEIIATLWARVAQEGFTFLQVSTVNPQIEASDTSRGSEHFVLIEAKPEMEAGS